jgi:LPS export ABC transporter protein LptC|tara:strand:- start:98647 stop:99210 length:564 start_codon:yes stop_codon:yes gene_type:complete
LNNRLHFYLLGLTPLLLAFLVWDLNLSVALNEPSNTTTSTNIPDAIVENPRVSQYDQSGKLQQLVQGTELLSFKNGDRLQVEEPRFYLTEASGDLWHISSIRGFFQEQLSTFELEGEVEMYRQSENLPIKFSTSNLEIDLNLHMIHTVSNITIQAPGHRVSGTGFVADLSTNQFEILNRVIAIHDSL